MNFGNSKNKVENGFTLAEVLITLAVVGIVSSISIPSLIANKNKIEYTTGLKKAYASLSQALQKVAQEMGCASDLSCTGIFNSTINAGDVISTHMNITQNCGTTSLSEKSDKGCWSTYYSLDASGLGFDPDDNTAYYKFITADGASFSIFAYNAKCDTDRSASNTGPLYANVCGEITIDVNGKNPPNRMGRDVFPFYISKSQLVPFGTEDDDNSGYWRSGFCDPSLVSAVNGLTCAARIMEEGWEMNY